MIRRTILAGPVPRGFAPARLRRYPRALFARERLVFLTSLLALFALAAGCRHDPVPQDIIDSLGPEKGKPSAAHRPGQPCLACHDKYGGAQPEMVVGGTVYTLDPMTKKISPAKGIGVTVLDSSENGGTTRKACTNSAGNFWVVKENWEHVVFPLTPTAGGLGMQSLIGRDGSCASCHKLPDDNSIDPVTGAGRDSAGVIIVDGAAKDPECSSGGGT